MLDHRERFVVMMQQSAPLLVFRRQPESDRMVLQGLPPDEQQVLMLPLDAATQLVPYVPRMEAMITDASLKLSTNEESSPGLTCRIRRFQDHRRGSLLYDAGSPGSLKPL